MAYHRHVLMGCDKATHAYIRDHTTPIAPHPALARAAATAAPPPPTALCRASLTAPRACMCVRMCVCVLPPVCGSGLCPMWARLPMNHVFSFAYICVLSFMRGSSEPAGGKGEKKKAS